MDSNFLQTIEDVHRGELLEDIDAELEGVLEAVRQRGGTGTITIKLKVTHNGEPRVEIAGTVSAKLPEKRMASSVFYVNRENRLSRNDPRQTEIFKAD